MNPFSFSVFFFTVLFFLPLQADAYIDPGAGSYVIQLVIGMLAGALFAVKIFWHKIRDFAHNKIFRKGKRNDTEEF